MRFVPTVPEMARMHRHVVSSHGWLRWIRIGVPIWAGALVAGTVVYRGLGGLLQPGMLLVLATVALWALDPVLTRWRVGRLLARRGDEPVEYRADAKGLHVGGRPLPWERVKRVDELEDLFVFIVRPRGGLYIPKRVLGGGDLDRLRRILESNLSGRTRLRRD